MSKRTAIAICVLGFVFLIGAGVSAWKAGPSAEAICTRGADRVILCLEQTSTAAADMSRGQRDQGIVACQDNPTTVQMYATCLAHEHCDAFMQCAIAGAQGK